MRTFQKGWMTLGALAMVVALSPAAHAQLNSNQANVNLNATLAESLTVVALPGTVTFALAPNGPANGNVPVAITTSWALAKTRATVKLFAYFSSAVALTDGAGDNIPTANVLGSVNAGAYAPFTGGVSPWGVNSMQIFSQAIGAGTYNATHNDSVALRIDTTGLGLPAAPYTGVLSFQAQAL
jgi:hypothetical protein